MTVHKSQGSEFDRVVLILPSEPSELLTRELIYTAVTRAKQSLEVWGNEEVFTQSVSRKVERRSGLRDYLVANFPRRSWARHEMFSRLPSRYVIYQWFENFLGTRARPLIN